MANLCDSIIASDINLACEDIVIRGLEPDGLIMNRADVDLAATVFDATKKNVIKTLVMKTGKKAYEVVQMGSTPFTGTQTTLTVGTYKNTFTSNVVLAILSNSPDVAEKIIDGLANGTFVVILKNPNAGTNGDAKYQIYGYAQGLKASEMTNEKWSEETDGGWLVTLQEASHPKSALFFFNTDESTTAAAYESLKTANA
jgi:hypothetical protein